MSSVVCFAPIQGARRTSLLSATEGLFDNAGLASCIEEGDLVAVKLHFGERGNTAFVPPIYVRRIVKKIEACGGRPFLTDSNTLYRGSRANAPEHIVTAIENGFGYSTVGAPIVIADGLNGKEYIEVRIDGKHFETVKIGAAAAQADAMIVVTHFKGHEATGFGGAMKNVGMGLGSRSGKQMMHADFSPAIDVDECTACGECADWCPADAIEIGEAAQVDEALCIGCGECVVTCPSEAIAVDWSTDATKMQEKIAEYVKGAVAGKQGKVGYLSFLLNVTPDCDCWHFSEGPIVPDIGILASKDLVAIEQASLDLVNSAPALAGTRLTDTAASDKFAAITGVDGTAILDYAQELGLGSREYELERLK